MTGSVEAPRPNPPIPTYTDAQVQKPWTVEHVAIGVDPQIAETEAQTMLDLAESLTLEETRGNIPQVLFQIPLVDHSPLEREGDEPKRRLWELKLAYGDDGRLEMLEMSTGHLLQSFRIRAKTAQRPAQLSYFGHHATGDKIVVSEKNNHPLWIAYGKRKLEELVAAATGIKSASEIDNHPLQRPWPGPSSGQ